MNSTLVCNEFIYKVLKRSRNHVASSTPDKDSDRVAVT